jgi:hypothetical protein
MADAPAHHLFVLLGMHGSLSSYTFFNSVTPVQ